MASARMKLGPVLDGHLHQKLSHASGPPHFPNARTASKRTLSESSCMDGASRDAMEAGPQPRPIP